ncbi:MAG: ribulose-phosphate 3-epimerase [Coriobacteriales bacterium]|jgi:ribulose-phosphate 3-epimerase|nr:ribulose-phosphate 3-epimerase [Coriobacteriales bacterium]
MGGDIQIAPSLLAADFLNLERDVRLIERERPEWLHVDVMDGHFVPNLTIGPRFVKSLKEITDIPLDVHLMISNPSEQLDWFLDAGADLVTVHVETGNGPIWGASIAGSSPSLERVEDTAALTALIDRIHAAGAQAGISLNPQTPASAVEPFIALVDLILVMSVHPGFGGQSFIAASVDKIAALVVSAHAANAHPLLEVDGGINEQTAPLVAAQGADILVAGNAIFGASNPCAALRRIREKAQKAADEEAGRGSGHEEVADGADHEGAERGSGRGGAGREAEQR